MFYVESAIFFFMKKRGQCSKKGKQGTKEIYTFCIHTVFMLYVYTYTS